MPVSQLRVFSSYDLNAPQLTGLSGSLVSLLDSVLVNGYGTKAGLGWTKPIPNDPFTSSLACWQMPSGSRKILYVNDAAPTGSTIGGTREAWATGYETILGLTGSPYPTVGTGVGAFPNPGVIFASISNGTAPSASVWWRKSTTNDAIPRQWVLFGDAHTFYLFIATGDTLGVYYTYWFGDLFSLKTSSDDYRCIIKGRVGNQTNASTYRFDMGDTIVRPNSTAWQHFYAARSIGGKGLSVALNVVGDMGRNTLQALTTLAGSSETACEITGIIPFPNPTDGAIHLAPLFVTEQTTGVIRGRLRGLYHANHLGVNFTDGQQVSGANELAGKVFQVVKTGPATFVNSTCWFVEISPTVETNYG